MEWVDGNEIFDKISTFWVDKKVKNIYILASINLFTDQKEDVYSFCQQHIRMRRSKDSNARSKRSNDTFE